jgi:hypothetical protein
LFSSNVLSLLLFAIAFSTAVSIVSESVVSALTVVAVFVLELESFVPEGKILTTEAAAKTFVLISIAAASAKHIILFFTQSSSNSSLPSANLCGRQVIFSHCALNPP